MAQLSIHNVTKKYGDFTAVKDFHLSVADGEFLSLLGPSGCGKTTLLRSIAGFFPIFAGEISIGNRVVSAPQQNIFLPPEKRNLGMVFQSYAVWPHMNVFDNIAYPLKVRKLPHAEVAEKVQRVVSMLNLGGQEKKNPSELSGGQQQRVALGRALVMNPDVLLLDEPLSNLDAKLRDRMRFELKEVQRRLNQTIVYVTHDQDEAMAVSDRIVLMDAGMTRQIGHPREIYHNPANLFSARFIGRSNFLSGRVDEIAGGSIILEPDEGQGSVTVTPRNELIPEVGQRVELVVRYQDVAISREPNTESLEAEVVTSTYLGGAVLYEFKTHAGMIYAETDDRVVYPDGESVFLTMDVVHVFPVTAQESAGSAQSVTGEPAV